ncbi:MAG: ATP-dependent Clp protease proteolytic subunit, partial [Bacteriovoracaceae bacterium]|nr:ATP-dependent Clp protease proteolytic subunit [Bacteriovoracaceae bacterium]
MKLMITLILTFLPLFSVIKAESTNSLEIHKIIQLDIESSINPATFNYLSQGFIQAKKNKSDMILVTMNTPGGLVTTTKKILTLFGDSNTPVVVWIKPEGASATSAGAIIASGAHGLYMSEGTNIGAATPIQMSGDIKQKDMKSKAINDLVALVQSLAETRGRNAKLFGEMIEKASSFKSKEAAEKNLIDGIANTESELIEKLDGRIFHIKGQDYN